LKASLDLRVIDSRAVAQGYIGPKSKKANGERFF